MCVRVIGDKTGLDDGIRKRSAELEEATKDNTDLHFQIIAQKRNQRGYFILGAIPVFSGKRLYRQIMDAQITCILADLFYGLCHLHMSVVARHALCLCPSAVSIQNNRHMIRNRCV